MKKLSECKIYRSVSDFFGAVCKYDIGMEHNVTVSVFADKESTTPVCYHRFQGRSRHNLLKILALAGIVAAVISLIHGICALLCALIRK